MRTSVMSFGNNLVPVVKMARLFYFMAMVLSSCRQWLMGGVQGVGSKQRHKIYRHRGIEYKNLAVFITSAISLTKIMTWSAKLFLVCDWFGLERRECEGNLRGRDAVCESYFAQVFLRRGKAPT